MELAPYCTQSSALGALLSITSREATFWGSKLALEVTPIPTPIPKTKMPPNRAMVP